MCELTFAAFSMLLATTSDYIYILLPRAEVDITMYG
jgi:hypothetical protein